MHADQGIGASGNFMWVFGRDGKRYLGAWSAGHFGDQTASLPETQNNILKFSRTATFPTSGSVALNRSQFGVAYFLSFDPNDPSQPAHDTALITFEEDVARQVFNGMLDFDNLPTWADISFDAITEENRVSSLCFAKGTYPEPTAVIGAQLNFGEGLWANYQFILDNALAEPRCSGALYFDENDKAVGIGVNIIEAHKNSPEVFALGVDDIYLATFFNMGSEENAMTLVEASLADLESQTP